MAYDSKRPLHLSLQHTRALPPRVISSPTDELPESHTVMLSCLWNLTQLTPRMPQDLTLRAPDTNWRATERHVGTALRAKLAEVDGIVAKKKTRGLAVARGRSKFLQTLYLLSVTCLRKGMRLVSLCTAGWLLKSGFLVVVFIRHRMTVTTIQAIRKTPMQ